MWRAAFGPFLKIDICSNNRIVQMFFRAHVSHHGLASVGRSIGKLIVVCQAQNTRMMLWLKWRSLTFSETTKRSSLLREHFQALEEVFVGFVGRENHAVMRSVCLTYAWVLHLTHRPPSSYTWATRKRVLINPQPVRSLLSLLEE